MTDGARRAYFVATIAEHYAIVWIFYGRSLFSLFLFELVHAEFTVIHALAAADAFFIVYCWVPWYFVSRDSVECFSRHVFSPLVAFMSS